MEGGVFSSSHHISAEQTDDRHRHKVSLSPSPRRVRSSRCGGVRLIRAWPCVVMRCSDARPLSQRQQIALLLAATHSHTHSFCRAQTTGQQVVIIARTADTDQATMLNGIKAGEQPDIAGRPTVLVTGGSGAKRVTFASVPSQPLRCVPSIPFVSLPTNNSNSRVATSLHTQGWSAALFAGALKRIQTVAVARARRTSGCSCRRKMVI